MAKKLKTIVQAAVKHDMKMIKAHKKNMSKVQLYNPKFPNGMSNWIETHHEMVDHITRTIDDEESMSHYRQDQQGHGGLYELGEELTDEFENKYKDYQWGEEELEYYEAIEQFLDEKEKEHLKKNK